MPALTRLGRMQSERDDDWRDMLEFNLLTAVRACRAAIPAMLERGGGAIVNISSVHGRQPSAVNVDYGAAKAAMINLTKALSEEFGPQGIRVNGVCPGPVKTPWWTEPGASHTPGAARSGASRSVFSCGCWNMNPIRADAILESATSRLPNSRWR